VKKEELLQTKDGSKRMNSGSDSLDKYTERMFVAIFKNLAI